VEGEWIQDVVDEIWILSAGGWFCGWLEDYVKDRTGTDIDWEP